MLSLMLFNPIFGTTLMTVEVQAGGGNKNDTKAEDHSNKQTS